jgi:protein-S-isoprenylcysteine O-methyltransferase Ste14
VQSTPKLFGTSWLLSTCAWRNNSNVNGLNKKALSGVFGFVLTIAFSVLFPAWTFDYWEAWVLISVFFVSLLGITLYLMENDQRLLERRLNAGPSAETQKSQKIGQLLGAIAFVATFVVAGLDHRFGWSSVPAPVVISGDVLVVVGMVIVFLVFRENTFTSATVEIAAEQHVVSSGPYSTVRHPMYIGVLIMMLGIPLALGSWWGTVTIVAMTWLIVRRVRDEEELMTRGLAGYREYRHQVRYRLLPFVW